MLDSQGEKFYFVAALIFLSLSLAAFQGLVAAGLEFRSNVVRFITLLFLAYPGPLLMEYVLIVFTGRAGSLRYNVKNPTVDVTHEVRGSLEPTRQAVLHRLEALGFEHDMEPGGLGIAFSKLQELLPQSFLDAEFEGTIRLRRSGYGTDVSTTLRFKDTILLDSGETALLEALAGYVCLRNPDFSVRQVPITTCGGVFMAFLVAVLGLVASYTSIRLDGWITDLSLGASGMIGLSLCFVQLRPRRFLGYRLSLLGLAICLVPFSAMAAHRWSWL